MRQLRLTALFLVIITLFLCSFSHVSGLIETRHSVFSDGSDFYVCTKEGGSVAYNSIKESKTYKYSFDNRVLAFCASKGKLYTAVHTNQEDVIQLVVAKDGKVVRENVIFNSDLPVNTDMAVDADGKIYFLNRKKHIEIYGADCRRIRITDDEYISVTQSGGKIYGGAKHGIYVITSSSDKLIYKCDIRNNIYAASDDFIVERAGVVIDVKHCRKVLSRSPQNPYTVCESKNYLVILKGNKVSLYTKSGGRRRSYELNNTPECALGNGDGIYVINSLSDACAEKYAESYFLPEASTKSDTSSRAPSSLSFGSYRVRGNCIFLPQGTTRSKFKSEIKNDGYRIRFSKPSGIGTGTKVTFTSDDDKRAYKLVIIGDITGTGATSGRDVDILFNCLLGINKVSGIYKIAADMNSDGKLSNIDLVMLDRLLS